MMIDHTKVDIEVLAQLLRMAEQGSGVSEAQSQAILAAVHTRKQALDEKLLKLSCSYKPSAEEYKQTLALYKDLILLSPLNYNYYVEAGLTCHWLKDYSASIAYYTTALQLIHQDPEDYFDDSSFRKLNRQYYLYELYTWRSVSYLELQEYERALEDAKCALRYLAISATADKSHYSTAVRQIYRSLRGLGEIIKAETLGTQVETVEEYPILNDEGKVETKKEVIKGIHWKPLQEVMRLLQIEV